MLKNYVLVSLRNLSRHKGYSFINVAGLATGLAVFVLIAMFIRNELSYDRDLKDVDDLYRVYLTGEVMGQSVNTTNTPVPLAPTVIDEIPEVIGATRLDPFSQVVVKYNDVQFYDTEFMLADSTFLDIFGLDLVEGDPRTALVRPFTLVITQEAAKKYFGNESPMGKILNIDGENDYEVTGILSPRKGNSHLNLSIIGSFVSSSRSDDTVWLNNSWATYLKVAPGTDPSAVEAKFPALVDKYVGIEYLQMTGQNFDEAVESGLRYEFHLEGVADIYLYSKSSDQLGPTGDIQYVFIMSAVALFVLLIACINFMNLSTARATSRAREVGLRKVMGSDRRRLMVQFMGESFIMSGISMILAAALIYLVLPLFNSTAGTDLQVTPSLFAILAGITFLTGMIAGSYPAFVLSGFRPVAVLKGSFVSSGHGARLRSALVVFQFVISIALLVGTGIVLQQLRFIQDRDVGFDKEQIVVLPLESDAASLGFDAFRNEIIGHASIVEAAGSNGVPGPQHIHQSTAFHGEATETEGIFIAQLIEASHEYVQTLGLEIIHGRNFSRDFPSDRNGFLINEAAAKELNLDPEAAVGTRLTQLAGNDDDSDRAGEIIGVIADAHFESVHQAIFPLIIGMRTNWRYGSIRVDTERTTEALALLETNWSSLEPNYPFNFYFMDEDYALFYEQERRLGKIYGYFAGLAIVIACLGLFGLASFVTQQRTKEIGVRKVLGASVPSVVGLLSKQFTLLVLLSCIIAFPVAYFTMRIWLREFAYATQISWELFALAGVLSIAIAWLTVGYQSIRAAVSDPVNALRHE